MGCSGYGLPVVWPPAVPDVDSGLFGGGLTMARTIGWPGLLNRVRHQENGPALARDTTGVL